MSLLKEEIELLKHLFCLLVGHKRKIEVFCIYKNIHFRKHYCERCHIPLRVNNK
jgi:hypothetical protein